jgi:quinol monooxygenase YgiN
MILIPSENDCQLRCTYAASVLVVNRFRAEDPAFRVELEAACAVLTAQSGCEHGHLGRNVDDPSLWVMVTRWQDVGSYRRALSAYDVKVGAVPLLSRAIDEPSAYEVVEPGTDLNVARTRSIG